MFALATLLLLLFALLHTSFVRAGAAGCLTSLLITQSATTSDLLRVQIIGDDGAVDASFVFAAKRALLVLVELPPSSSASDVSVWNNAPTLQLPRESACLNLIGVGDQNPLWALVRDHVLGYDTIVLNLLARSFHGSGFVYLEAQRSTVELRRSGVLDPDDAATSVRT